VTKLSVNINKLATLRNARGHNRPDILQAARDIERFGAEGITVHPRPDERHIRYQDVRDLKAIVTTELNVEGNPTPDFLDLVREVRPEQVTLVPDAPGRHHVQCRLGRHYAPNLFARSSGRAQRPRLPRQHFS
jgi:pyridoxine 5-phosphate synthase